MRKQQVIHELEQSQLKSEIPEFHVGDTIAVSIRIIEGAKERVQIFTGTVIARKGSGLSETFSLHRVAYGEGMERVFLLHSPRVAKIEVVQEGDVRRAKLYHLRGTQGKKAKVKQRVVSRRQVESKRSKKAAADALRDTQSGNGEKAEARAEAIEPVNVEAPVEKVAVATEAEAVEKAEGTDKA